MSRTLFCITSMSKTMIDLVLYTDDALIVSPRKDVVTYFENLGKQVLFFRPYGERTVKELDVSFKDLAMPGEFEDAVFNGTELHLWEVLSLDRLKFWYTPYSKKCIDFLEDLEWDLAYVSFDIGSVFPISVAKLADSLDIPCIAVKTEPIISREIFDIADRLAFSAYIVSTEEDQLFLQQAGVMEEVVIISEEAPQYIHLGNKDLVRKELRVGAEAKIIGLLFDKRDEWAARNYVEHNLDSHFFVFPVDSRSADLINSSFYRVLPIVTTITRIKALGACDKIIAFRYDDNYPKIKNLEIINYE